MLNFNGTKQCLSQTIRCLVRNRECQSGLYDGSHRKIAEIAYQVNRDTDNIGARRLHTILEKLLEDLLFEASEMQMGNHNHRSVCGRKTCVNRKR